ncbi:MAG: fibronectin type III domain-containing protein, partial [Candidatus Kapabacteria bacterium]|nr:fibronectin type III domain-containing protein [Candidatus Kapabacteria bacterium]
MSHTTLRKQFADNRRTFMKTWLGIQALVVICATVVIAGCGDTSTEPVVTGRKPVAAPTKLEATSINEGSVGLRWASSDTSVTAFLVRYSAVSGSDSTRYLRVNDSAATTVAVTGLREGVIYSFTTYA